MEFRNLYIHVPFCRKKCDYCAFYSMENSGTNEWNLWLEQVLRELAANQSRLMHVNTVYFGGGTPTLPDTEFLHRMYTEIFRRIGLEPGAEITSEANPETLTEEKAALMAQYVNRVSMGVQSFSIQTRRVLGRHPFSPDSIYPAFSFLRKAGIGNIGLDLMYAVPGQTEDDWYQDLKTALELEPEHLSCYALTPEENTPYAKLHGLEPPDDELSSAMWHRAGVETMKHGMMRYEVSNYAKNSFTARHNCAVWAGQTYLGIGPAASSFDGTDRWTQVSDLRKWYSGTPPEFDRIEHSARCREILMMGLRTVHGWTLTEYRAATGNTWQEAFPILQKLAADGLLILETDRCRPTELGLEFWNTIAEELLM